MLQPIILAGSQTQTSNQLAGVCPLHFETADGVSSRFQQVLAALSGDVFATPVVVTTRDCADLAVSQSVEHKGTRLLLEPQEHKPAAALLSALLSLKDRPEAIVVVAPATARFADVRQLDRALCHAIPAAQRGEIVLFGHRTARAYGGYGTLEVTSVPRDCAPVQISRVLPSGRQTTLGSLFQANHQLWGLGIYVARVEVLLAAFRSHASRLFLPVKNALLRGRALGCGWMLDNSTYSRVKPLSFEKAVAQKVDHLAAIQMDTGWSEWSDWAQDAEADQQEVHRDRAAWDADLAEDRRQGAFGSAADMMAVYRGLADLPQGEALAACVNDFDWGRREMLAMGPGFSLMRLTVNPGASLNLSAEAAAPEHWVVVQGSALITLGDHMRLVWESQSARIPAGRKRRVENPGSAPLQMIQLQVCALSKVAGSSRSPFADFPTDFPAGVA